jgi:acyl-CoA thioesterase
MRSIKEFFKNDRYAARSGIELLEVSQGRARARMHIEEHHFNGIGVVHGGAVFTLAELAFAAAANSHGIVAVAINASIWYVKAAIEGTLVAEAREVSLNPRLATYSIEVRDDAGEIVAAFEGMVYRKKQTIQ